MSDASPQVGSPRVRRLATPSWLDLRLVLGVLLVLGSVVIGARVVTAADHLTPVYVARVELVPGEQLRAGDLAVSQVRFDGEGSAYVAAGAAPVGYVVTRHVGAGELLPVAALSADPGDTSDRRFVTVPVSPGHLPVDLVRGDLVDVYVTTKSGIARRADPPTRVLAAVPVDSYDDGSTSLSGSDIAAVVLAVPAADVDRIIAALEGGDLDLVRVPVELVDGAGSP
ncbi:MAG: SAF domain-containing protein [Frankiaceae bacterium]|nr:SAF domain-containing protein [Frankiaceae bacterium]MBV9872775.1 SAF domain-containing protein [Frankiaceae bacterium]